MGKSRRLTRNFIDPDLGSDELAKPSYSRTFGPLPGGGMVELPVRSSNLAAGAVCRISETSQRQFMSCEEACTVAHGEFFLARLGNAGVQFGDATERPADPDVFENTVGSQRLSARLGM